MVKPDTISQQLDTGEELVSLEEHQTDAENAVQTAVATPTGEVTFLPKFRKPQEVSVKKENTAEYYKKPEMDYKNSC